MLPLIRKEVEKNVYFYVLNLRNKERKEGREDKKKEGLGIMGRYRNNTLAMIILCSSNF
jgi:predicted helicase